MVSLSCCRVFVSGRALRTDIEAFLGQGAVWGGGRGLETGGGGEVGAGRRGENLVRVGKTRGGAFSSQRVSRECVWIVSVCNERALML